MQYKLTDHEDSNTQCIQKTPEAELYTKIEPSQELHSTSPSMFQSPVATMTSSPASSPTYQDSQSTSNLGYTGSMYVPGSRSVLPSMQYLSNSNQVSSASFWGMQPELGYSHAHTANSTSGLSKPFTFDPTQSSTSPTSRNDSMNYAGSSGLARPNPYSSYMGTDLSPWSMAIQQGLHRIGAGELTDPFPYKCRRN